VVGSDPTQRARQFNVEFRVAEWLGADVLPAYLLFKRAEIKAVENLAENAICRRYAEVY
jgi:glutamine synthetase